MLGLKRRFIGFLAVGCILCGLVYLILQHVTHNSRGRASKTLLFGHAHPRYAYATFLGPHASSSANPSGSTFNQYSDSGSDPYFTSVRLLAYQILHAPQTRTRLQPAIPFLVLTLPAVPAAQISLLASEGATVVPIQPLDLPSTFDQSTISRSRFRDVLAKLRVWELTQYDKILSLDADTIILSPLDSIFTDPQLSTPMTTLVNTSHFAPSKFTLPSDYLLSASADTWGHQADWIMSDLPAYLCACFMLLAPSKILFEYYQWVLNRPEASFVAAFPDQDLLIYAHRPEGRMPWRKVPLEWSANDGAIMDTLGTGKGALKSLHVKAWDNADGENLGNERSKQLWKRLEQEMKDFYLERMVEQEQGA